MSSNKVVLITGSSKGIGAETAIKFAQKGFSVCINYKSDSVAASKVEAQVKALGVNCIVVQADVSKENEAKELFRKVDEFGRLSVLVNNTGILMTQSKIEDISIERFTTILNVNVLSCFLCTKEAAKRMSTTHGGKGGTIVNVSSGAAKSGSPFEYADYAASKGAIDTFTRGAAMELANTGIRVNCVRPGLIKTTMHAQGGEPNRVDRLTSKIPLQRGGEATEVAEAIYWLASEKSSFCTGTFIDVMGGL